jgi:hypothetical protein
MTAEEYLAKLEALMAGGRHQEALAFSTAASARIVPPLTADQRETVYSLMEMAATLASLARDASALPQRETA